MNITDAAGNWNSTTIQVTVKDVTKPVIDVGSDAITDEDIPYNFDASDSHDPEGGTIVLFNWSFGDGSYNNGSDMTPSHTYIVPGTYTVILKVTDSSGNWATATIGITVNDTTPPVADAGSDDFVDEDTEYTFDSNLSHDEEGQIIAQYLWDFDDIDGVDWNNPDSTVKTPSWTYDVPGTYTVTLRVIDAAGNWDEDTMVIIVNDTTSPVANAGLSGSVDQVTPYMLSGNDSYDPEGGTIVSYKWDIDDSDGIDWNHPDYEGMSVVHTFSEPGIYNVTLRVEDAAGNFHTDTVMITVIYVDIIPPAKPSNLMIEIHPGGNALNISWYENTEQDIEHYELYFSITNDTFTRLADIPHSTTEYSHEELTNEMTYYYYLVAVDVNGNPSDNSDIAMGVPNLDTDGDGIPNPTDPDDDNDGLPDIVEIAMGTEPLKYDSDGDGYGDKEDEYPMDPNRWEREDKSVLDLWWLMLIIVIVIVLLLVWVLLRRKGGEDEIIDEGTHDRTRSMQVETEELLTSEPPGPTEGAAMETSVEGKAEIPPSEPKKMPPRPPRKPSKKTPIEEVIEISSEEISKEPGE